MKKYRLFPEQYSNLWNEYKLLLKKRNELIKEKNQDENRVVAHEFSDITNSGISNELILVESKIREYEDIFTNFVLINSHNPNVIEVGTTFTATIDFGDGEIETNDYTLVDTRDGFKGENYISINSDLGKSVLGKNMESNAFGYRRADGIKVSGTIDKIMPRQKIKLLPIQYENIKNMVDNAQAVSAYDKDVVEKLKNILLNSEIVESYEESVDIGTRFQAVIDFNGEIDTQEYMLVATREGLPKISDVMYVSTDSEFGKNVLGKNLMESFYFPMENNEYAVGFVEYIFDKELQEEKQKIKR